MSEYTPEVSKYTSEISEYTLEILELHLKFQNLHLIFQVHCLKFQCMIWNFRFIIWSSGTWSEILGVYFEAQWHDLGSRSVFIYIRGFHYGAKFFTKFFTNLCANLFESLKQCKLKLGACFIQVFPKPKVWEHKLSLQAIMWLVSFQELRTAVVECSDHRWLVTSWRPHEPIDWA